MGAGHHRQPRDAADVVIGLKFAGLEDHLQVGRAAVGPLAGLADRDDLLEHLEIAAGEERSPVDDHVDLICPGRDRIAGVGELDGQGRPTTGERRRDGGDVDL